MKILLLNGSLNSQGVNQALLEQVKLILDSHEVSQAVIDELPFYRDTLDGDNRPAEVSAFISLVEDADALIIATPEYNHSIPAPLKNALDWASRPAFESPLKQKKVTVLSGSPSPHGGHLAQAHLKQILKITLSDLYPSEDYLLSDAYQKVDNGVLTDTDAQRQLESHIQGFTDWL